MTTGDAVVVGTAGHIDHGKTSLVRALTGVDPDTLPEEQARGITIALGFAPMTLPDGRLVAFVDVPGHERLVRTMVAGATGIDAVLLCVSAVDGVMPQTREHLAILQILGIRDGAVVLTMADLVDAELLELARADVSEVVRGTFLDGKPIVAFSSVTGIGREELVAVVSALAPNSRPVHGPFRLAVDRVFVRPGFGTVVTGTAWSGTLRDGEAVRLLPKGTAARVRGMQVHGAAAASVQAGWRVAVNLAGIERDDVERGTVVASGEVACTAIIDVRYHHLPDAPPLEDGAPIRLLHGTAERLGRLAIAEQRDLVEPGDTVWAQLRLEAPLACLPGDRFVVRRPSPQSTLGGGEIVDPWAPRLRRKDRATWARSLARLQGGDRAVWLERAGEEGIAPEAWAERSGGSTVGVVLGDRVLAPGIVARLEGALLEMIEEFHRHNPLALGANRRELRRDRLGHLSERMFDALVERLVAAKMVTVQGPLLRFVGFAVALDAGQRALRERLLATIAGAGLEGARPKEIHDEHPEPEVAAVLHLIANDGAIVEVPGVGWVLSTTLDELEQRVRAYFVHHPELTPGDFKELTGLSRKSAIPLLEHLDKIKITRRVGDVRVRGSAC